jgi:hypothetical protein
MRRAVLRQYSTSPCASGILLRIPEDGMRLLGVAALLIMCGIALSAVGKSGTLQNSQAPQPDDIPKSIAESVSGTLQFAEGNFVGLAEAMPEDKYSYIPTVGKFDGVRSFGEQSEARRLRSVRLLQRI